jgi:pyruvate kinase
MEMQGSIVGNPMASRGSGLSMLEHHAGLDLDAPHHSNTRHTKIVCTIGPKTQTVEMLKVLIKAGMAVSRMNFSHGSHEFHQTTIDNTRKAAEELQATVAIALDTKGPEIRTGDFENPEGAVLNVGDTVTITTDEQYKTKCSKDIVYVDYKNITKVMTAGRHIFIDDGVLDLEVKEVKDEQTLICVCQNGHTLTSRKGCNLPMVDVDLPAVSAKDKEDLAMAAQQQVDFIFASFIRDAAQVREVRKILTDNMPKTEDAFVPLIISKIENFQGVRNIDEIIAESDGIMVARGDLGVEIPAEKVVLAQKMLIAKCNIAGKPVICATQMLESMTQNPRPTRAEVSDVANAVFDGADAVMLSGETAKGKYPKEVVEYMAKICLEAQNARRAEIFFGSVKSAQPVPMPVEESICSAGVFCAFEVRAKAVIVLSNTGRSSRLVAKYRPDCPIVCVSEKVSICRSMCLNSGVRPVFYDRDARGADPDREKRVRLGMWHAVHVLKVCKPGDYVFAVHADPTVKGFANQTRVVVVPTDI